ncbi:MAG: hypothetical protein KDE54_09150, partial [Caldilineaceae bacterium]|nr:hypothetical protein [Caldilineaceae bacterium]
FDQYWPSRDANRQTAFSLKARGYFPLRLNGAAGIYFHLPFFLDSFQLFKDRPRIAPVSAHMATRIPAVGEL